MELKEKLFAGGTGGTGFFIALLFLALLLTGLAMGPCLDNGFINWDETEYITGNHRIKTLSWENVKTIFSTLDLKMYSPLSTLSYALNYHFSGLDPKAYHASDLLLHLANTALVMVLVRLLLTSVWAAFFTALLFGIHPAHVESVAWAAERKDVLYAFFYLSSLAAYAWRPDKAGARFLSLALFVCAMLSKPMAITLPAALLLVDYLKSRKLELRHVINKIPFFVFAAVFIVLLTPPSGSLLSLPWTKRLLVPLYNLGFYVYTLLWPFDLSAMHTAPAGKTVFYAFAAGTPAVMFLLWKYLRRDKEIIFGAAFFVVMLLPVLQFFPFGQVISADRYTYLSSIGIFIIGAVSARRLWRRLGPAHRGIMAVCAVSAVLVLAVAARVRCAVWKDGVSLWSDTLRKQPLAAPALTNLCDAYLQANMIGEAAACLSQATRRDPGNNNNHYNVCRMFLQNREFDRAEECFTQMLKVSPCHAAAHNYLGDICLFGGRAAEAARYYTRAVQCDDTYAPAYLNLGKLALSGKDTAKAVSFYEKALSAEPADKETRALLNSLRPRP
ncbi:MAG: tetratricopeptide repeat protein [Elusimicrobiota bacterium]|nr:tetratricopeptide repeat protein [Elusimicrobiota bacterium]